MPSATLLKDCRHGRMLFLQRDQYVGRSLDLYGEFSEGEAKIFEQIVRPGDVVVEVGANMGAHTVHLARLAGPTGAVAAFEPQRVIFQLLCANLVLNELFNVHAVQAGVGREPGVMTVPVGDHAGAVNFGGLSLSTDGPGEAVQIMVLDDMSFPSIRLLKIDVEGMECEVLAGARAQIARHRPLLYVENDRAARSAELIRLVDELGYDAWWHVTRLYNPQNFNQVAENVFGNTVSINMLCTPKESGLVMENFHKVTGPDDSWERVPVT